MTVWLVFEDQGMDAPELLVGVYSTLEKATQVHDENHHFRVVEPREVED